MLNGRELEKLREIGEECSDTESNATRWELSSEDESNHIQSETSNVEERDEETVEENVTTDNFFTSTSLATKLLAKKTTLVGTIRANKRDLPKAAKQSMDNMPRFSTLLYRSENCILTINKSKPNKRVVVLSSRHKFVKIDKSNRKMFPDSIQFYNKTKFGVDMTDQRARKYMMRSSSCRWPLQIFFNILDLAAINAWILYKEVTGIQIERKRFLLKLAEQHSADYTTEREKHLSQQKDPQVSTATSSNTTDSTKRKICQIRLCHNNKTNNISQKCKKYVCGRCTSKKICTFICLKCPDNV